MACGPSARRIALPPRGKRETTGQLVPRFADVGDARETLALVGEPPFVDEERRVDLAVAQRAKHAIVGLDGDEHGPKVVEKEQRRTR